jgi:hypothetical protein
MQRYELTVIPNWHESTVAAGKLHVQVAGGAVRETYTARYWPGDALGDHLEFALKYDGVNLLILKKLFALAPQGQITAYVRSKPGGKYARRIWYLYELLTGNQLPIPDVTTGNYVDLLEPDKYYTTPPKPIPRQRVRDNLLGDASFCPIVRRTERLAAFERSDLSRRCRRIVEAYPLDLLKRALAYLYTRESKSSFQIEHLQPSASRIERFVSLLQQAERDDFFQKQALIELQNRTVDQRFRDSDYRTAQNYVGETVPWQGERVHFVSPKPADLACLMDGMFTAHARMGTAGDTVHPVVHAAVVGYGFVFMHPFEDGNGRIHRFLIHNVLARRSFAPPGIMFPISAAMLKRPDAYDASLEAFSKPLMPLVEYSMDEAGRMTVQNDTADYYRYIDLTAQAEALSDFVRETIEVELVEELRFLANYDATKRAIQQIVDMPDRLIDLFIRCCLQNHGTLSKRKRQEFFAMLHDSEVTAMEAAIQQAYHPT